MTGVYTVRVGWTTSRPVVPDQQYSFVRLVADDDTDAVLGALQLVGSVYPDHDAHGKVSRHGRPGCVMVTSSLLLDWP